jgi:bacillithiol system protein YtxJ
MELKAKAMNWIPLTSESQLEEIITESFNVPVMIFKHSTRCSISSSSLNRLERNWQDAEFPTVKTVYLDLIAYRPVSSKIESDLQVEHQSPQAIVIKNGKSIWDASHYDIQYDAIKKVLST